MPKFVKGSEEAKEHMRKIREKRGQPKPEGYVKPPKKTKAPKEEKEKEMVKLTEFGEPKLTIPEFFVVERKITHQTGKKEGKTETKYQLVNPLTKTRNLSTRKGQPSITILRKPIQNDFIHLSHKPDEPIPLSLFSTKDRDIIRNNFDVIDTHKDKPLKDIPVSKFYNKTRGRPELLPKNIAVNLDANTYPPIKFNLSEEDGVVPDNIIMKVENQINKYRKDRKYPTKQPKQTQAPAPQIKYRIVDKFEEPTTEPTEPKKRGKAPKYATDEERKEALRIQKRDYMRRQKEKKEQEGKGIISDITKKVKKATKKLTDYGKAVIYGRNDYQPKVRNILERYGDNIVRGIRIKRTPVPALFTHIMGALSQSFSNNLSNAPYDELYHLFIGVSLDDGTIVSIEKNEVINMDINPQTRPETDELIVIPIPPNMSILSMMEATHKYMGNSFFKYSAKNNNCQDFILAIFDANGIGDEDDRAFIKQDTKSLFNNTGGLSKITDTITNLGGAFNSFTQGAGVIDEYGSMVNHLTKHITDPNEPIDPQDYKQATHLIKKIKQIKEDSSDSGSDSESDEEMEGGKIETITPSYVVQSIIFDMPKYEVASAVRWLKHNGLKAVKADIEEGQTTEAIEKHKKLNPLKKADTTLPPTEKSGTIRFRQMSPVEVKKKGYTQYRIKELGKDSGISLVLVYKEGRMKGGELFVPEVPATRWQPHLNEGVINKKSMSGGRIKLVKGSKEAKEFMAKMREMRGKKQKNE
jgi:hypothetical protein